MSKAVLFSIKPKYCELIASGKKSIEVRKTRPKIDVLFKGYIYCTKNGKSLIKGDVSTTVDYVAKNGGKVIGEFVCDTIITDRTFGHDPMFKAIACMSDAEIASYCTANEMYGFHISNLLIYDKPKELSEFEKPHEYIYQSYRKQNSFFKGVTRPPQSWGYVEEL